MSISKVNVSGTDHQIVGSPRYATCSTAAATAAKVATIADGSSTFSLEKGARICVSFTYANTASAATLNVASTGAKAICWNGSALVSSQYWQAGAVVDFVYDGNGWSIVGVAKDRPVFYVTITGTVASPTADKTPAEIYQAYENGYAVYANVTLTGSSSSTNLKGLLPLTYIIAAIDAQHAITFSSTSGKEIKEVRYSPAIRKWEVPYSGVIATNDDLPSTPSDIGAQPKITAKGLLKGNGNGVVTAADETEVELVDLPQEVFWATYGETTAAELNEAWNTGKLIKLKQGPTSYELGIKDGNKAYFYSVLINSGDAPVRRAKLDLVNGTWEQDTIGYVCDIVQTISLPTASWAGSDPYTQKVTIFNSNVKTKVDIQPSEEVYDQLVADNVGYLAIKNVNGTLTAVAKGGKPSVDLTVQVTYNNVY